MLIECIVHYKNHQSITLFRASDSFGPRSRSCRLFFLLIYRFHIYGAVFKQKKKKGKKDYNYSKFNKLMINVHFLTNSIEHCLNYKITGDSMFKTVKYEFTLMISKIGIKHFANLSQQ